MKKILLLILGLGIMTNSFVHGQNSSCPGLKNPQNFMGWYGKTGIRSTGISSSTTIYNTASTSTTTIPWTSLASVVTTGSCGSGCNIGVAPDSNKNRFQIITTPGNDSYTGGNISRIPNGNTSVIRLGDMCSAPNESAEALFYEMTVSPDNALVFIDYALVSESPSHGPTGNPEIIIRVCRKVNEQWQNAPINDSLFYIIQEPNSYDPLLPQGWATANLGSCLYMYKPWTRGIIDLSHYLYDEVRIEIYISDCSAQFHGTYCYIAGDCQSMELTLNTCSELVAPQGMNSYQWQRKTNAETWLDIQNATDSVLRINISDFPIGSDGTQLEECEYKCIITSALDPAKPDTTELQTTIQKEQLTILDETIYVTIDTNETYTWNGVTFDVPGTYTDTLQSANGCDSIVTLFLRSLNTTPNKPWISVEIENDTIFACPNNDVILHATVNAASRTTTQYLVEQIPYNPPYPYTSGTPVPINNTDDIWALPVTMPFNFSFYGTTYNTVYAGSNGVLSFTQPTSTSCEWAFSASIPNATFPIRNAIYGVYQDSHLGIGSGTYMRQGVLGEYPNRVYILNFNQVPLYSCTTVTGNTYQIVLYEGANIIDIYVGQRSVCQAWQNGVGLIGIQNSTGTQAITPPNRNTGAWTAQEEAWRFKPTGESLYNITWYIGDSISNNNEISRGQDSVIVSTDTTKKYIVKIANITASNDTINAYDTVVVHRVPIHNDTISIEIAEDKMDNLNHLLLDSTGIFYIDTLQSILGCDSVVVLKFSVYSYECDTVYIHDTIYVRDSTTNIEDIEVINARVYSSHNRIVVEGADGNNVMLFDMSGRLLATKRDEYSRLEFEVPISGAYFVKIGNYKAKKVVVIK